MSRLSLGIPPAAAALAACVAAAPAPARAQAADSAAVGAALASLPPAPRAAVLRTLDSARAGGLPEAPLRAKLVEGVAKGAPPDRIAAVVGDVAAGLRTARAALGAGARPAELAAAGAAAQAGASAADLRRVRDGLPGAGHDATQAFVVLTDLARRGVAPNDAAAALARLARAGAGAAAFAALRAQIADDVAGGTPPRAALGRRVDAFVRAPAAPRAPITTPAAGPLDP